MRMRYQELAGFPLQNSVSSILDSREWRLISTLNKKVFIMGAAFLPVVFFTGLFGGVGVGLPFFIPESPNKKVLQVVCMLTGACCWLFWLTCYMAQMNPLIGPILHQHTALVMQFEWGNGQSAS